MTPRQYNEYQRQADVIEQHTHSEIERKLLEMKNAGKWIALELWPPVGQTTIQPYGNEMRINDSRDGKWIGVSEAFYDSMVQKFDSRDKI